MHVALPTRSRTELTSALGASKTGHTISSLRPLSRPDVSLPTLQRSSTSLIALSGRLRNDVLVSEKPTLVPVLGEQPRAKAEYLNRLRHEPSPHQPTHGNKSAQVTPTKVQARDYVPDSDLPDSDVSDSYLTERHPKILLERVKKGGSLLISLDNNPSLFGYVFKPPKPEEDVIVWYSGITHLIGYAEIVKDLGGFYNRDASSSKSLNFRSFPPDMGMVSKFLSIMDALREQKLNLIGALRRLYILFRSYPQVWQGLNLFLPGDYRLTEHGCIFPDGSYVQMACDERKGTEYRTSSLKDTIPDRVSIRKAICLNDMMIGTLFMKLTISEDRTGQNGSEARARLCALLDDSEVSTGRHLRIVSQLNRKGR